jgi:type IV pilus assembly protein PilA
MNKGFTLIEMIAVVIIVGLISLVSVPPIVNQLVNKKQEINGVTEQLIYDAAELYIEDNNIVVVNYECISLDKLVTNGYLKAPIKDAVSGEEISLTKYVKATKTNTQEYNYTLTDKCISA